MLDTVRLLRRVSIFEGLDEPSLADIGESLRAATYEKDQSIVNQDDPGDSLYIMESGRVKVTLHGPSGREVILSIFKSGDFFGEMSLLDGQPRSASVVALEASRILILAREDFVRYIEGHPKAALRILAEMSKRLRKADEVIGNLALLDVYGRIARVLMDLAEREGQTQDEGILIRERPTQQELASMSGTSRETVSRVLSELQRRGYLTMQGKAIMLGHGFAEAEVSQAALREQDAAD